MLLISSTAFAKDKDKHHKNCQQNNVRYYYSGSTQYIPQRIYTYYETPGYYIPRAYVPSSTYNYIPPQRNVYYYNDRSPNILGSVLQLLFGF